MCFYTLHVINTFLRQVYVEVGWALSPIWLVSLQEEKWHRDRATQENAMWWLGQKCHRKPRNTKYCQQTTRHWEEAGKDPCLEPLAEARPCWQLDFGLLASRTMREYHSAVLSHPVCGICYGGPKKQIKRIQMRFLLSTGLCSRKTPQELNSWALNHCSQEKHRVRFPGASGHNISSTNYYLILVSVGFCWKTSYLVSIVNSLMLNLWPTAE